MFTLLRLIAGALFVAPAPAAAAASSRSGFTDS